MGIQVVWDDEAKRVIRYIFDERWSWEEFFAAKKDAYNRIATVHHKVGIIMDAPPNMALPPNVLTNVRSALRTKHPNTVVVVFVITTPFLRTMMITLKSLSYLAPVSLEHAATLDEARAIAYKSLCKGSLTT